MSGPYDPAELVEWAEKYGHPEEWAKKAQAAHGRAEDLAEALAAVSDAMGLALVALQERVPRPGSVGSLLAVISAADHAANKRDAALAKWHRAEVAA